jgi:hypothetical protein
MTPGEALAVCGPSWTRMTVEQREDYGPPLVVGPRSDAPTLRTIAGLLDLVREFPRTVSSEGLARTARRWDATPAVVALAEQVDALDAAPAPMLHARTLAALPSCAPRSLMAVA